MTLFVVVAALMAALAASAVAVPLVASPPGPHCPVPSPPCSSLPAAAALYPLWSNWHWHDSAQNPAAGPDVAAMVAKLETHLREDPNDLTGWVMLGRSYVALERMDDAIVAYDHAHRLDAGNAEAALGLGEAMSLRAGGNITPEAAKLFEQALSIEPGTPRPCCTAGSLRQRAATSRPHATAGWRSRRCIHRPRSSNCWTRASRSWGLPRRATHLCATRLRATRRLRATPQRATPQRVAPRATRPEQAASDADVSVNIRIAPAIKARLTREAPLFVFAREPGGKGPPLAAKRLTSAAIGTQIHLSAADSMIPGGP